MMPMTILHQCKPRQDILARAHYEDSNQTTITNGTTASADNTNAVAGAVYVYKRSGSTWAQEAYIKAANNDTFDNFGYSVSLDQDTLAVGALKEDSNQTTITNGTTASADDTNTDAGAVYVYKRTSTLASGTATNPPVLDAITPSALNESAGSTTVFDLADGGDDFDGDSDALVYSCWFDNVQDDAVNESAATLCNSSNMPGMSFDSSTGILSWDPVNGQDGSYEFKVVATDNNAIDVEYVDVSVTDDL